MARVTIQFDTDNAAFEDDPVGEVAFILENLEDKLLALIEGEDNNIPIHDSNGNTVGEGWVEDEDEDEGEDGNDEEVF